MSNLLKSLESLPNEWALVPVKNKAPYEKEWQKSPRSKAYIESEIACGKATGVGVLCGTPSNGSVLCDHDGSSCDALIEKVSGLSLDEALPTTATVTSGRPGRYQSIYRVPEIYWGGIETRKIATGVKGDDGKPEQIEFRWDGTQSVVIGKHPMTDGYRWINSPDTTAIADAPLWMIEQMLKETKNIAAPETQLWTELDWANSYLSAIPPTNDYDTWLHVGMALHSVDQSLLSAWDDWSQGAENYEPGVCEKKWESFNRSGLCIGTLGYLAKQNGWKSPFTSKSATATKKHPEGENSSQSSEQQLSLDQIKQKLETFISEGRSQSDLEIQFAQLAQESGHPIRTIEGIYKALSSESDLKIATQGAAEELEQLRSIKGQQLPIEQGLFGDGGAFATKIRQVAAAMPTAPEFLVTTLIPAMATAMGTAQTLVIHATAGYVVRPIFRSIIIAETGRKKTPAQSAILKAITTLEETSAKDYDYEIANYELEHRAWMKEKNGPEPKKPTRRRYMTQDSTLAARIQIHAENPRGLLLYKDEASAFITERGRFINGKGDGGEFEADLSEFNGGTIMCDRKGDGSTFISKTAISRVGATQFSTLQRLMGSHNDDCGEFARYLFCSAEAPPSRIDLSKDVGDIGLTSAVMELFDLLHKLPEQSYLLSSSAKTAFEKYQHELTDRQIAEDHPSLQSAYPKFETYFARFVLWLHLVNAILAGEPPKSTVDGYIVDIARQWTEYFIGQLKLVLAVNSPQQELTGDLLKLYDYLKRKNKPLAVRTISQGKLFSRSQDRQKHKTPYYKELLNTLIEKGWLAEKDGFYSIITPPNGNNVDQMLGSAHLNKPQLKQAFSPSDEKNVEQLSALENKSNSLPSNGHVSDTGSEIVSDRELVELLGGGSHASS